MTDKEAIMKPVKDIGNVGVSPQDIMTENGQRDPKWRGLGLYFSLLSVQTTGVGVLLANIVPLYRMMSLDFSSYKPDTRPWWAIAGILLVQIAYWLRVRLQPPLPLTRNIVLGHIVFFVARISFVCVTASFTLVFLNRFPELKDLNYPPVRVLVTLLMFFSIFCWTLELERLAKGLQDRRGGS